MKTRNKLLTLLILSSGAAAATALINKAIKLFGHVRNVLEEPEALCYKWRLGNIHYTKTGTGKPILLVHDLAPASSGFEWKNLVGKLFRRPILYIPLTCLVLAAQKSPILPIPIICMYSLSLIL